MGRVGVVTLTLPEMLDETLGLFCDEMNAMGYSDMIDDIGQHRSAHAVIADRYPHYENKSFVEVWDDLDRDDQYALVGVFLGTDLNSDATTAFGEYLNDMRERFDLAAEDVYTGPDKEGMPAVDKRAAARGDKWVSPGRLVLTWPDLDATAQRVLFVMAAHGDNNCQNIYIAQSTIAGYIGKSRRTVQYAMKRLSDQKVITMTAKPRRNKPTTWKINRGPEIT